APVGRRTAVDGLPDGSRAPETTGTARTLVVLQPGYLPWLGFFHQMARADVFVYYDDVQYDKHGWRKRNHIKTQSGPQWLTVPVLHHGRGMPSILEAEIDRRQPWARKHVASLRQASPQGGCGGSHLHGLTRFV